MQSKGLRSLTVIMMVAIGTVSVSTSVVGHDVDLGGTDAMEELALIMAAAAEQELTAKAMDSTKCIETAGWSQDLTLSKLDSMITIFKGKAWFKHEDKFIPPVTYLFAPQCPKLHTKGHVYVSNSRGEIRNHAEDNMAARCGLPREFYLTSAPCPNCAMMLFNAYSDMSYRPLIHIARPYQGKGKPGSEGNKRVNLHCLAMLMDARFTIVPWNWSAFEHDYITNNDCKESIKGMISNSNLYNERYEKAMAAIGEARCMSLTGNHDHHEICSNAIRHGK